LFKAQKNQKSMLSSSQIHVNIHPGDQNMNVISVNKLLNQKACDFHSKTIRKWHLISKFF
jgi:hypothetical protein